MFRPMRRKNKEISLEAAQELLAKERRGVLAVNGDDNYPYAIPINFVYDKEENKIYFHGSKVGHKIDSIKNSDKVCFTTFGNEMIKDVEWAPYMQSVVVFGRCKLVTDSSVAGAKLVQMAQKYYPNAEEIDKEIAQSGQAVQMYEIVIEHMTGKEIQER